MGESLGLFDEELGDDMFFTYLGEGEESSCFMFDSLTFIVTCDEPIGKIGLIRSI